MKLLGRINWFSVISRTLIAVFIVGLLGPNLIVATYGLHKAAVAYPNPEYIGVNLGLDPEGICWPNQAYLAVAVGMLEAIYDALVLAPAYLLWLVGAIILAIETPFLLFLYREEISEYLWESLIVGITVIWGLVGLAGVIPANTVYLVLSQNVNVSAGEALLRSWLAILTSSPSWYIAINILFFMVVLVLIRASEWSIPSASPSNIRLDENDHASIHIRWQWPGWGTETYRRRTENYREVRTATVGSSIYASDGRYLGAVDLEWATAQLFITEFRLQLYSVSDNEVAHRNITRPENNRPMSVTLGEEPVEFTLSPGILTGQCKVSAKRLLGFRRLDVDVEVDLCPACTHEGDW